MINYGKNLLWDGLAARLGNQKREVRFAVLSKEEKYEE